MTASRENSPQRPSPSRPHLIGQEDDRTAQATGAPETLVSPQVFQVVSRRPWPRNWECADFAHSASMGS